MSQGREGSHLAERQYGWHADDDQTLSMRLQEYNTQHAFLQGAPLSPQRAGTDPLEGFSTFAPHLGQDWESGEHLGEHHENLELSGNHELSDSEMVDSSFERTDNVDMDDDPYLSVPERFNSTSSSDLVHYGAYRAHTALTPSRSSNYAESLSSRPHSMPWSEENSGNLRLPTYTPHNSSAATRSQYSDSAWETVPSTPLADDYDLRPVPDDNSASMQSYNHPQAGIWPQENGYGRRIPSYAIGNGVYPTVPSSVPQRLQEVLANADAATPFGMNSHSYGGASLVNASLGADRGAGLVTHALSPLSTTGISGPQSFRRPPNGQGGVSIVVNGGTSLPTFPIQHPSEVERPFFQYADNQEDLRYGIILDSPNPPAPTLPPAVSTDSPSPPSSPLVTAHTATTGAEACTHSGCQIRYTGKSRKDTLRRHKRTVHNNESKPECPKCGLIMQSGRPDNLKRHIMKKHPGFPLPASLNVRPKNRLQL